MEVEAIIRKDSDTRQLFITDIIKYSAAEVMEKVTSASVAVGAITRKDSDTIQLSTIKDSAEDIKEDMDLEEDIIKLATKDMEVSAVADTREVSVVDSEDTREVSAAVDIKEVSVVDSVDTKEVSAAVDTREVSVVDLVDTKEVSVVDSVDTRVVSIDKQKITFTDFD